MLTLHPHNLIGYHGYLTHLQFTTAHILRYCGNYQIYIMVHFLQLEILLLLLYISRLVSIILRVGTKKCIYLPE